MQIQDGDIVFFDRYAARRLGFEGNYHWVGAGAYPFGHVGVGSHINMSPNPDHEPKPNARRWLGDRPRVTWGIGGGAARRRLSWRA
jgi:hypothetical protein